MTATWTNLASPVNVGDQIGDDFLTTVVDNLSFLRDPPSNYYALSTAAANLTTSSATMVDLTGFTITFTTQGRPIDIIFSARVSSANARFDIFVDGVSISSDTDGIGAPAAVGLITEHKRIAVNARSHTVKIQWRSASCTVTLYAAGLAQLFAREIGPAIS